MADAKHYDLGDVAVETVTFKVNDANTDPGVVTATVWPPSGTPRAYTYGIDPQLGKSSVGTYFLQIPVDQAGQWFWKVIGTTPAPGSAKGSFIGDPDLVTLTTGALTTLYNAELALDRLGVQRSDADEAEEQAYLARLVNGYTQAAMKYLDRQLLPTETDATKRFVYDGSGHLDLAPYELNTAGSILFYADQPAGAQWELTSDDYRLRPQPRTDFGTWSYLSLPDYQVWSRRGFWGITVDITGDWGATSIPDDVSLAVDVAVALGYAREEQATPRVFGGLDIIEAAGGVATLSREAGYSLPQASRNLLAPYRRG